MARVDVIMPQMGESIVEGTITKWHKSAGDEVKRDESILEISTDKVDADIPSPVAGTLVEILAQESETVEVGSVIARIETEAGASADVAQEAKARQAAAVPAAKPAPAEAAPAATAALARPVKGDGAPALDTREGRLRTRSTPLVRRIAAEHEIDVSRLTGSGISGRVTKKDIMTFIAQRGTMPAGMPGVLHVPIHGETLQIKIPDVVIRETDRLEEMSVMRQRI
ncbi:MAG: biotin/lipoyl-containing protein, partial [Gemmatimonadota bacterium]